MGSWNRLLLRLSRWPRRIAALACLLLAGISAVQPAGGAPAGPRATTPPLTRLRPGQVAVPLSVAAFETSGLLRVGARVGVLTGPADGPVRLVADRLRVLSIHGSSTVDSDTAVVVVAADRAAAVRLAPPDGAQVVVVVDAAP